MVTICSAALVFVFDYHPAAETLYNRYLKAGAPSYAAGSSKYGVQTATSGGMSESTLWSFIVQISAALRTIHASGMALRIVNPTKILVVGRGRFMINCAGLADVLPAFDHMNVASAQQNDMLALGALLVALCCGSSQAALPMQVSISMKLIRQNYSPDVDRVIK